MKKHIILFALAAATLCACSSDEILETSPPQTARSIEFTQAFVTPASRAAVLTKDYMQRNGGKFAVWGYMNTTDNSSSVQVFARQTVNYTNGSWTYTPLQYWVANRSYKFFALASTLNRPSTLNFAMPTTCTAWGNTTFNYRITEQEAFTDDLAYATADVTTLPSIETQPAPVSFTFNHVLSQVLFTIEDSSSEIHSISVSEVKYTGIDEGSFVLAPSQGDKTKPNVIWTPSNTSTIEVSLDGYYDNNDTDLFTTKGSDTRSSKPIFVIPNKGVGSSPANNGTLSLKCKLYQGTDRDLTKELDEVTKTAMIEYNFQPGHSYHVKVSIENITSGYPITFTVNDVTSFVDENNNVPVTID